MRVKTLNIVALIGATLFTMSATTAFADNFCMSAPYGWFVEVNGGSTRISDVSFPGKASTSGIGGNINLGYKFMPYFGLEIGYTQYATTSIKDEDTKAADIKHYSYDMTLRGIWPLNTSGFELFAKLGIVRSAANIDIKNDVAAANLGIGSSNHTDTGMYSGIGAQYYFKPEFAVVGQWQRADGNKVAGVLDLYTIGFSVLFV